MLLLAAVKGLAEGVGVFGSDVGTGEGFAGLFLAGVYGSWDISRMFALEEVPGPEKVWRMEVLERVAGMAEVLQIDCLTGPARPPEVLRIGVLAGVAGPAEVLQTEVLDEVAGPAEVLRLRRLAWPAGTVELSLVCICGGSGGGLVRVTFRERFRVGCQKMSGACVGRV